MLLLRAGVVFTFQASAVYCERLTPAGENALYETYEYACFYRYLPRAGLLLWIPHLPFFQLRFPLGMDNVW